MEILTPLSLLIPAFSLEQAPQLVSTAASLPAQRSPTDLVLWTLPTNTGVLIGDAPKLLTKSRSFGGVLEPRYIFRAGSLDQ